MRAALFTLLLLIIASATSAGEGRMPSAGDSLKLRRDGAYEHFTLVEIRQDTLMVVRGSGGGLQHIDTKSITGLKVYARMGRGTGAARGGTIGFFVGAVSGFVLGSLLSTVNMCAGQSYTCLCDHWAECGVMNGIVFAIGGTVVGAAIGAALPGMHWEPVDLPLRLEMESGGRNGYRFRIALSLGRLQ